MPSFSAGNSSFDLYHSAYVGVRSDKRGRFTNFVCRPDESHKRNGYWRFNSLADEHRAFELGYHTPEDIIVGAVDGDGPHDDINLRWVAGQIDTNMKGAMTGNSRAHLRDIFDMRRFLGKPLSFRGSVPLYPTHPRLAEYWNRRCAVLSPQEQCIPLAVPGTMPVPPNTALVPPVPRNPSSGAHMPYDTPGAIKLPQVTRVPLQSPKPTVVQNVRTSKTMIPKDQIARPRNGPRAPIARANASTVAQSTQQVHSGNARDPSWPQRMLQKVPVAQATQLQAPIGHLNGQPYVEAPHIRQTQTPNQNQGLRQLMTESLQQQQQHTDRYSQHLTSHQGQVSHVPQSNNSVPSKGPQPSQDPLLSTSANATNQLQSSNNAQSLHPLPRPHGLLNPTSCLISNGLPSCITLTSNKPRSIIPTNPSTTNNTESTRPLLFNGLGFVGLNELDDNHYTDAVSTLAPPPSCIAASCLSTVAAAPSPTIAISSSTFIAAPHPTAVAAPLPKAAGTTNIQKSHEASAVDLRLHEHHFHTPKSSQTSGNSAKPLKRSFRPSLDTPVQQRKRMKVNEQRDTKNKVSEQIFLSPTPHIHLDLPCIDCGEDEGHKWDCNIGNLCPITSFTMLDYRSLADSVHRFDPGPWTKHEAPPSEPESEETEVEMKGIANFIKNEEAYKDDDALQALPDDLMILQWAFKTSPDLELIESV